MLATLIPLLVTIVVCGFGLIALRMTIARNREYQELEAVKLAAAEKKYVDERIAEIDKALGKTLAPILDDIGQIRTRLNITQKM